MALELNSCTVCRTGETDTIISRWDALSDHAGETASRRHDGERSAAWEGGAARTASRQKAHIEIDFVIRDFSLCGDCGTIAVYALKLCRMTADNSSSDG